MANRALRSKSKRRVGVPYMITAVFSPKVRRDIHPGALGALDMRLTWITQGPAPESVYPGQDAWLPVGVDDFPGWVPTQDLADIEVLARL